MSWAAVSAIAISTSSLFVSVAAVYYQRKHARVSVRPFPQIIFGDYENCLEIAIHNAGIGPLVVERLEVACSLEPQIKHSIIDWMPPLSNQFCWTTFVERFEKRAIAAQDKLTILCLECDEDAEQSVKEAWPGQRNDVRMRLGYLTITLFTADIYGVPLAPCRRSLNWFHRNILAGQSVYDIQIDDAGEFANATSASRWSELLSALAA